MSQTVPNDFDLKRSSQAIVTALINLANSGRSFQPDDLEITYVKDLPTGQYPTDADRELKVRVKATDISYPVYVKSKDIAALIEPMSLPHEGESSAHDLVAKINAATGAALTAEDLQNVAIPSGSYPRNFAIPTNPKGIFWNGNIVLALTGAGETTPPVETPAPDLTGIEATPDSLSLTVGETGTVAVTPVPAEAKLDGITWSADSADVEVTTLPSGGVSVKGLVANDSVVVTGKVGSIEVEVLVAVAAADDGE